MQLIVLGMHRSGTSVLARALNLMGAYFGPEGISTGANPENPKGFWERRDVRALNDSVLHGANCDWNRVLKFDPIALPAAQVADFDKRASSLILEMDAHRPWLLKEPRLCLLLPLWRRWLEAPVCIHIFRNPVEVASSLRVRNEIPIDAGLVLWDRYVRSAMAASDGLPQVVVSHRRLMQEPVAAVSQLFRDLTKLGVLGLREPSGHEVNAFVQEDLYRERESREDLQRYADAPQLALFKALETGRTPPVRLMEQSVDIEPLARYEAGLPPLSLSGRDAKKPQDAEAAALRGQLALREQEIRFVREMSSKFEADIRRRDELLGNMERDQRKAQETIAKLRADLAQREDRVAMLEALQAKQAREAETAVTALRELRAEHVKQNLELEAAKREADDATSQLEQMKLARISAERVADLRLRDLSRMTRMLMQQDNQLALLKREIEGLADRVKIARKAQGAAASQAADAEKSRQAAETQAAKLQHQLDAVLHSATWRMGAPIRAMMRFFRRRRGGAQIGDVKLVRQSEWFDADWYLRRYPDVAQNGVDPAEHYLGFGGKEGRNPGPKFNTARYLDINRDVAESGMNALVHYLRYGRNEGRQC